MDISLPKFDYFVDDSNKRSIIYVYCCYKRLHWKDSKRSIGLLPLSLFRELLKLFVYCPCNEIDKETLVVGGGYNADIGCDWILLKKIYGEPIKMTDVIWATINNDDLTLLHTMLYIYYPIYGDTFIKRVVVYLISGAGSVSLIKGILETGYGNLIGEELQRYKCKDTVISKYPFMVTRTVTVTVKKVIDWCVWDPEYWFKFVYLKELGIDYLSELPDFELYKLIDRQLFRRDQRYNDETAARMIREVLLRVEDTVENYRAFMAVVERRGFYTVYNKPNYEGKDLAWREIGEWWDRCNACNRVTTRG